MDCLNYDSRRYLTVLLFNPPYDMRQQYTYPDNSKAQAAVMTCGDHNIRYNHMVYRLLVAIAVLAATALAAHSQNLEPGNILVPVNQNDSPGRGVSVGGDNADRPLLQSTDSLLSVPRSLEAQTQNWTTIQSPSTPHAARQDYPAPGAPMFPGYGPASMPQPEWAVSPKDFQNLLTAISSQTFASNQLPMIQAAGLCGWFTCSQCAALMNLFDFDSNRLQVVRYLAPHIIDPIRCQPIMDQLSFSDDKQTAWNILSTARP